VHLLPSDKAEKVELRVGVLETATGHERYSVDGLFSEQIPELAFLPDGKLLVLDRGKLTLYAAGTGKVLQRMGGHHGLISTFSLAQDGKRLLTCGEDGTGIICDVAALIARSRPALRRLHDKELAAAWSDLGSDDAARAGRALEVLAASPTQSVALVQKLLSQPDADTLRRLAALLEQLDDPAYARRHGAEEMLLSEADLAEPGLRARLAENRILESRRRMERLLEKLEARPLSAITLQLLCSLELLEGLATDDARAALKAFAARSPLAWGTLEARQALGRLGDTAGTK
jgi:hypothetical protein